MTAAFYRPLCTSDFTQDYYLKPAILMTTHSHFSLSVLYTNEFSGDCTNYNKK